jgi:hypothetical protein
MESLDVIGGESVYCINKTRLRKAYEMASKSAESGTKILSSLDLLESELSRDERAARAFIIIDRLLKTT